MLHDLHYDSSNTSASSASPPERKSSASYRRARAKVLSTYSTHDLIDLVLKQEHKLDNAESRLRKSLLKSKEHADAEFKAYEQAKKFRQKMTQLVLDAQEEAARAKQEVEQYKLKLENSLHDLRRAREVVRFLETDKDQLQRELKRARDKARGDKERSAVQLAREQGRRIGFEQGLEQGRLVVQLTRTLTAPAAPPPPSSSTRDPLLSRRALTQAPSTTANRSSGTSRRSSLDHTGSVPPVPETIETRPPASPTEHQPPPPEAFMQARSDGGGSITSRASSAHRSHRSVRSVNLDRVGLDSPTTPSAQPPPRPPVVPQGRQFPAGVPPDNVSEVSTSPASTMGGFEILSLPPPSATKEPDMGVQNAPISQPAPPPITTTVEVPQPSFIPAAPPEYNNSGFPVPAGTWDGSNSAPHSNRSSLSLEISIIPPSQPGSPPTETEGITGDDPYRLSPHGQHLISLPPVQPQPQPAIPTVSSHPHESPVVPLPVLPRVVSSPTPFGTPAIHPSDLAGAPTNTYTIFSAGTGHFSAPAPGAVRVYEEAPTPAGFQYPTPLGAVGGGEKRKGKGRSVTLPNPSEDAAASRRHHPYSSPSSFSPAPTGGVYAGAGSSPYATRTDLSSSSSSSTTQPVVPSVVPGPSSPLVSGGDDEEDYEDTSFDSTTKMNTQLNARIHGQGNWS